MINRLMKIIASKCSIIVVIVVVFVVVCNLSMAVL